MTYKLVLKLPDEVYEKLLKRAKESGRTIEVVALEILANFADRLRKSQYSSDKNWSVADCSSFVVMRYSNILEAFTTDHHFEQAGFVRLLK